jgi:hypothetical protein
MAFNVTDVVEPMDWDFTDTTVVRDATADDKGRIPEPSTEMVDLFRARYYGLFEQLNKAEVNTEVRDAETRLEAAERILEEARKPLSDRIEKWAADTAEPDKNAQLIDEEMIRIVADVCGGCPTEAQLRKLPSRHFRAFCRWLNNELEAPKFNFAGRP